MTDQLTLYGVTVLWDGVPLGGEVRAYDEAQQRKGGDVELIESLSLAILNYRRPAASEPFTLDRLRTLPMDGSTVTSLREVVEAIQGVMKGEIRARTETRKRNPGRATGGASGQPSATTTPRP